MNIDLKNNYLVLLINSQNEMTFKYKQIGNLKAHFRDISVRPKFENFDTNNLLLDDIIKNNQYILFNTKNGNYIKQYLNQVYSYYTDNLIKNYTGDKCVLNIDYVQYDFYRIFINSNKNFDYIFKRFLRHSCLKTIIKQRKTKQLFNLQSILDLLNSNNIIITISYHHVNYAFNMFLKQLKDYYPNIQIILFSDCYYDKLYKRDNLPDDFIIYEQMNFSENDLYCIIDNLLKINIINKQNADNIKQIIKLDDKFKKLCANDLDLCLDLCLIANNPLWFLTSKFDKYKQL